jgi:quinol monooxygenase YgiN
MTEKHDSYADHPKGTRHPHRADCSACSEAIWREGALSGLRRIFIDSTRKGVGTMLDYTGLRNGLVVTAFWKAKPDETEAVAAVLQRFMPQAQQEPGVRAFMIHQSKSEPSEFFFYEVFEDEDAFAAHQQTPHFKALIAGEALPKLIKRKRAQYAPL